ncbi:type II and III secretion system protein family protein [Phenylobacterium sp.]|uniref:type II and III secretion system protein family protein n=1 Tax=Phenylobacterium sp. TaxID=1871053 RepID=UPI00272878F2|nr:type II and III secretion system protein family protein [Phenylobacterium sp.]MDO8377459.1 type II and III secretion system protein family protein [Phenylobacterium sp.]
MLRSSLLGALAATLALATALPACAEQFSSEAARSRVITVPRNKSASFRLDAPASKIVVAQPETAQIVATTDRSFYVRGKALGSTNLLIYGAGGTLQEVVDVRVGYDADALQADLAAALPGEMIEVRNLGEGLLLAGDVSTTAAAAKAKALAEKFAPGSVTSALTVRASQQVILEVRVLEASRSSLKDIGFNIAASNNTTFALQTGSGLIGNSSPQGALSIGGSIGTARIDLVLRALEEQGVIRTLAKPNLVALSGEKASFLAGGEFPFPVPNGRDSVTIEFRPFGVTLDFQPTVQDNGLIRLQVAPEVSQLDSRAPLKLNGVEIPSLIVRRANTTVELRSGESFAIAGLFQQDYSNSVRQLPGAGEVPVLGALFRSSRWKKAETELVIIVTPRMAGADDYKADPAVLAGNEATAIDLILNGLSLDKPLSKIDGRTKSGSPS